MSRVGVDSAQLAATVRSITNTHTVNGPKTAGKFVHIMGAALAGLDAVSCLRDGDYLGADLNTAVTGGVGMAVMFRSTSWGWTGRFRYRHSGFRRVVHSGVAEGDVLRTPAMADFLTQIGFEDYDFGQVRHVTYEDNPNPRYGVSGM